MILRVALLMLLATPAFAAGPVDPDWPCVQRRQPQLSLAQVWTGPPADEAAKVAGQTPEVQLLAARIALRRTAMEEVETLVETFAAEADPAQLTALFEETFAHIQIARDRVMSGITRYAHKQAELDHEINKKRQDFLALETAEPPDFDAIDKLEAEIDWSTRIFQDRQQSLTYVCETPVILEQRAFAIGRIIAKRLTP